MSAARFVGAFGSLAVHAALLLGLLTNAPPLPEQQTPVMAPELGEDEEMRLVATPEADGTGLACEASYRGIGIQHWHSGAIIEVVADGPADRAGIRVGDYLLSDALLARDQYEVGKQLPLRIERDGRQIEIVVRIGVICFETPHTIPHLKD